MQSVAFIMQDPPDKFLKNKNFMSGFVSFIRYILVKDILKEGFLCLRNKRNY